MFNGRGPKRRHIGLLPGDWRAHYQLGLCDLELGKPAEARESLETALLHRPGDERVVDAVAEAMYRQGDQRALFAFLAEQAESTKSVGAYLRLGRYCVLMDDPDSAQAAFETAIAIDGGQTVDPHLELAALYRRLGDMDEAVRHLRRAYAVDPADERVGQQLRELGEVPGPTLASPG